MGEFLVVRDLDMPSDRRANDEEAQVAGWRGCRIYYAHHFEGKGTE